MANPTVTVYSKERCVQCTATERWLTDRGIPFNHEDATTPENTEALKALGYMQAPVVFVSTGDVKNDEHWSGFNPTALELHVLGKEAA